MTASKAHQGWVRKFDNSWQAPRKGASSAPSLRQGVLLLLKTKPAKNPKLAVANQPFDGHLLEASALYKRSRSLFLKYGGAFEPSILSSARTLGSATLLEPVIEYNPVAAELYWVATDPIESQNAKNFDLRLQQLRALTTNVFHEQNHRLLWGFLPPAPRSGEPLRRYMNLAEALVITLDMALGDELGPSLATFFQCLGVAYDPGTDLSRQRLGASLYRRYLHAAFYGTYLNLQGCEPQAVLQILTMLFPELGTLLQRVALRSSNLNPGFVEETNPAWQARHGKLVARKKGGRASETLKLPDDALDHRYHEHIGEAWFRVMGL